MRGRNDQDEMTGYEMKRGRSVMPPQKREKGERERERERVKRGDFSSDTKQGGGILSSS
jgi:hypothetical protein